MFNILGFLQIILVKLIWLVLWLLVLFKRFIFYEIALYMIRVQIWPYPLPEYAENTRILFLITHIDDGCLYFGPIIVTLSQVKNCDLHVMCMMDNSDERYSQAERIEQKNDLLKSCAMLGIPEGNVILVSRQFESRFHYLNFKSCANCVLTYIEGIHADLIYTFDKHGVDGHPHHVFLFRTLSYMCMRRRIPPGCRVFKLRSISMFRRFLFFIDLLITEIQSRDVFIADPSHQRKLKQALNAVRSQSFLKRLLFQLSRFSYINSVDEMAIYRSQVGEQ